MAEGNGRGLRFVLIFPTLFLFYSLVSGAAFNSTDNTMPPDTPPPNTPALLNEVIVGVKVLQRLMKVHMRELGSLYQVDNTTQESKLYAFSVLSQSLMTIDILERSDIASNSLSIYKVVVKGILDDTCHWFASHVNSTINCNDRSSVATLFLTLGLKPQVRNLSSFIKSLPHLDSRQEANRWVTRTFQHTNHTLQCHQLCRSVNLRNCCPDQ